MLSMSANTADHNGSGAGGACVEMAVDDGRVVGDRNAVEEHCTAEYGGDGDANAGLGAEESIERALTDRTSWMSSPSVPEDSRLLQRRSLSDLRFTSWPMASLTARAPESPIFRFLTSKSKPVMSRLSWMAAARRGRSANDNRFVGGFVHCSSRTSRLPRAAARSSSEQVRYWYIELFLCAVLDSSREPLRRSPSQNNKGGAYQGRFRYFVHNGVHQDELRGLSTV
mmetsp:Transcript_807/g.2539  ORF Transcript_807/g.2539 Transcript_807/m.2539 type:complete len:226 (-) Transcript_807:1373-2050(-)